MYVEDVEGSTVAAWTSRSRAEVHREKAKGGPRRSSIVLLIVSCAISRSDSTAPRQRCMALKDGVKMWLCAVG